MADYSKKTQGDNAHLANGTSARFVHIDGNTAKVVVRSSAGRLLRAVINTAGINAVIRNGSEEIAVISTTAIGTLNYGVYCDSGITVDVISGTGSLTLVYGV